MQQGSSVGLAARTAGMTDEQILGLEAEPTESVNGHVVAQGGAGSQAGDLEDVWETPSPPAPTRAAGASGATSVDAHQQSLARRVQGEPAWLKQLETQPGAA